LGVLIETMRREFRARDLAPRVLYPNDSVTGEALERSRMTIDVDETLCGS